MFPIFSSEQIPTTPYLFFTGKGGVGKTSTACASAVSLADQGKKVLIVSTDPASNLQDVFNVDVGSTIMDIPDIPGISAINLDPEAAASAYREKVVGPYRDKLPASVVAQMEEQLSGACTVEIAAFDEFSSLLTKKELTARFDHIIFDTAPTGHTLRLLQLPSAWSGFLEESTHGASCLGPLAGLEEKKSLYEAALDALSDEKRTTLLLVARPDDSSIAEGGRAAKELADAGLKNQLVIMNGVFEPVSKEDDIAAALYTRQQKALGEMKNILKELPIYKLPYISYPLTGIEALRKFFNQEEVETPKAGDHVSPKLPGLNELITQLTEKSHGVIMTMGKGGVGKTTIASAIAVGLAEQGKKVHLTTTDPAAHLNHVLRDEKLSKFLSVSRIDPEKEAENYKNEIISSAGQDLDEDGLAYLEEDLNSPCTEEIAVFRAFANLVERAREEFVIIDTAPTGHTLLLLDASQSYNQEIQRSTGEVPVSVANLLPRLRNKEETDVVVVTLPEATPVLEASRLQEDLKRANISPSWWIINQSLSATKTKDALLQARGYHEAEWISKVANQEGISTALIPWIKEEITGTEALLKLVSLEK